MDIAQASPAEFTKRANALLHQALRMSIDGSGDQTLFIRCMSQAKAKRLTWVEGLEFTIATLKHDLPNAAPEEVPSSGGSREITAGPR